MLFRLPAREWAESAIQDLAGEGCAGRLVQGPDSDGCWTVLVNGPAREVRRLRRAVAGHSTSFCWEAFVNRR